MPTKAPTNSPTTMPTTSPLFDFNDGCIDMTETCETDISTVQLEWGLSRNEACCNDGGGYIEMMGIINKEKSDRIASDLEFDTDFTYSFWVKITNDNSLKQILVVPSSVASKEFLVHAITDPAIGYQSLHLNC